jgi:hypothetical protein
MRERSGFIATLKRDIFNFISSLSLSFLSEAQSPLFKEREEKFLFIEIVNWIGIGWW